MAKNVISIHAEDTVVREDTAKAYRGVFWGLITAAICLAILAALFIGLVLRLPVAEERAIPAEAQGSISG